jgi:signal transduction histidine kinase
MEIRPASDLEAWDSAGSPGRWEEGALLIIARPSGYAGRYVHKEALLKTSAKPTASGPVSFRWTTRTSDGAVLSEWGGSPSAYLPNGAAMRPGPGGLELSVVADHRGSLVPIGLAALALVLGGYLWSRRRKAPPAAPEIENGIQPGYWKAQETIRRLQARLAASERALATPKGPLNGRNPVQLGALAHELRTPLNAILGFSEMMDREMLGPLGNETYRDYARSIQESGQTLANRVEDVLALAALDAGERRLQPKPGDLMEPVLGAASALMASAETRGVQLLFGQRGGIWANLDREALGESVGLFLAAQIEDTPPNGTVRIETVRAGAGGGPVLLRLLDNGEGRLSLIAETAPGATPPMGALSPLRLTLARRLLEAMGSTVEIRSNPRQGNEIRIWLASAQTPAQSIDAA